MGIQEWEEKKKLGFHVKKKYFLDISNCFRWRNCQTLGQKAKRDEDHKDTWQQQKQQKEKKTIRQTKSLSALKEKEEAQEMKKCLVRINANKHTQGIL